MRSEELHLCEICYDRCIESGYHFCDEWFERTLDDSANKRLSLRRDSLLLMEFSDLCMNVVDGLVVYPKVIEKRLCPKLPFMATENIMMDAVKAGGDRQELHERIRELSMEAGRTSKVEGLDNNLLELNRSRSGIQTYLLTN